MLTFVTNNKIIMFIKIFIPVVALVAIAGIIMAIRIILQKNGKFPETEIGRNKEMRKRGIICAKAEEIKCRREVEKKSYSENPCNTCHL